jgi:hypothetical protein
LERDRRLILDDQYLKSLQGLFFSTSHNRA